MFEKQNERFVQLTMRFAVLARALGMRGEHLIEMATDCRLKQGDELGDGKVLLQLILRGQHVPSEEDVRTLFPGVDTVEYIGCYRPQFQDSLVTPRVEVWLSVPKYTNSDIPQALHEECARVDWKVTMLTCAKTGEIIIYIVPKRYGFVEDAPRRAAIEAAHISIGLTVTTFYKECGLEGAFCG